MSRSRNRVTLWLDTETTGTDPERHGIVQLAGSIDVNDEERLSFNFKVRPFPEDEICDEAIAVHGITREAMAKLTPPQQVHRELVERFSRFVNRYDKTDKMFFAGYNAQFDLNFMHGWFRKCGDPYFGSWVWWPAIDVSVLAMERLKARRAELKNFKLWTVLEFMNICPDGELHDALTDIRLTKALYWKIMR